MNDRPATDLLAARIEAAGIRPLSIESLAGGHWAVLVRGRHDTGTPDQSVYLYATWSSDDPRTGESGAAIIVHDPDRDDWDNYSRVLWDTRELVSPDVVADLVSLVTDHWRLDWWNDDHHRGLAHQLSDEAALVHDLLPA